MKKIGEPLRGKFPFSKLLYSIACDKYYVLITCSLRTLFLKLFPIDETGNA
jgi:hypothetical protein